MQWRQLTLFPMAENATSMSFDWWVEEVREKLYAYTGIPLKALLLVEHHVLIQNWVGGELNLVSLYKGKRQPLEAVLDILDLLVIYPFDSPTKAQHLGVRDNRKDEVEDAFLGEEYFEEIHGVVYENLIILDRDFLFGELDFPSQYQLEERQKKLGRITKAPGLKPFCHINSKALLTTGE